MNLISGFPVNKYLVERVSATSRVLKGYDGFEFEREGQRSVSEPMLLEFLCLISNSSLKTLHGNGDSNVWWSPYESSTDLDGFEILEGDMLVPKADDGRLKNAIKSGKYLWERGIIPYDFGGNFTSEEKDLILSAMDVLEEKTCVDFVENDNRKTFIRFHKDKSGCFAPVGRLSGVEGALRVNLQSPQCFKKGIIEHELLHVAGLFHEQSRPDRDEYVTVHWCNIESGKEYNFRKASKNETTTFDVPYGFGSIMHYPRLAFSKNGKPTITAKADPEMTLGQRMGPSEGDIEKVVKMYGCKK